MIYEDDDDDKLQQDRRGEEHDDDDRHKNLKKTKISAPEPPPAKKQKTAMHNNNKKKNISGDGGDSSENDGDDESSSKGATTKETLSHEDASELLASLKYGGTVMSPESKRKAPVTPPPILLDDDTAAGRRLPVVGMPTFIKDHVMTALKQYRLEQVEKGLGGGKGSDDIRMPDRHDIEKAVLNATRKVIWQSIASEGRMQKEKQHDPLPPPSAAGVSRAPTLATTCSLAQLALAQQEALAKAAVEAAGISAAGMMMMPPPPQPFLPMSAAIPATMPAGIPPATSMSAARPSSVAPYPIIQPEQQAKLQIQPQQPRTNPNGRSNGMPVPVTGAPPAAIQAQKMTGPGPGWRSWAQDAYDQQQVPQPLAVPGVGAIGGVASSLAAGGPSSAATKAPPQPVLPLPPPPPLPSARRNASTTLPRQMATTTDGNADPMRENVQWLCASVSHLQEDMLAFRTTGTVPGMSTAAQRRVDPVKDLRAEMEKVVAHLVGIVDELTEEQRRLRKELAEQREVIDKLSAQTALNSVGLLGMGSRLPPSMPPMPPMPPFSGMPGMPFMPPPGTSTAIRQPRFPPPPPGPPF